ncbi:hypothetical protein MAM1_0272d09041 [Mucor ambiguus]|uniref:Uncharacterized protein n=1 Tax=Mucor ambiguus TaxID=91626 RepID=A0A0C9MFK5_9FUNG|nr:hypothetical protein MAM1_0272d09041 [Mucor ambiguus]
MGAELMIPRTGTIVSLTGYFFPSQVRLVDRGAAYQDELLSDEFITEVYSNDKPYGVKVIIPNHLSEIIPNPENPDTDKVYFVHVMGHYFEAAAFDPVNSLQPFGNYGRMHINAICFDIARCMLPTDLYSSITQQRVVQ